jgi:DNA-binding transcriptional regulator GbsR (MarR family)
MDSNDRNSKQRLLIEEIGRYFDKEGYQPIAGRILGLLMVMDKEMFTFEEITGELNISKSSASNILRDLEHRGNIEYVTFPGDRKRYFRIRIQDRFTMFDELTTKMANLQSIVNQILELKSDKQSRTALLLADMDRMIEFFSGQIAIFKQQYTDKQ